MNTGQGPYGSNFTKPGYGGTQVPSYGMTQPQAPAFPQVPGYGITQPQAPAFPQVPSYGMNQPQAPSFPQMPSYGMTQPQPPSFSQVPAYGTQPPLSNVKPLPQPTQTFNTFGKPPVSAFTPPQQNIPKPPPVNAVAPTSLHRSSPSPGPGRSKYVVDPSVGGSYNRASTFNPTVGQAHSFNNFSQPYNAQPAQPYTPVPTQLFGSQQIFNPPTAAPPIVNQPSPYTDAKPQVFTPRAPTAPGWNDPPLLSGSTKSQQKEAVAMPEPITHPLLASGSQFPEADMQQQYNPVNQMKHVEPYYTNTVHPSVPVAKAVEPPQPKAPLPEEHMYLQTVFEELRNRCTCAANNPQLRKKLEDVARKLEVLYDALRSAKLSVGTLSGLHELVQAVQNGDYTGALHLHTQLVSGPDFSQISSFMPGLKVLIQSALQLGVYLQ